MARRGTPLVEENGILGRPEKELRESDLVRLGAAFTEAVRGRTAGEDRRRPRIVVGFDTRPSSREMQNALVRGIASLPSSVIHIGIAPLPVVLFSLHKLKLDGAVWIGGSDRPAGWSGLRFHIGRRPLRGAETRLLLRRARRLPPSRLLPMNGRITYLNMAPDYLRRLEREHGAKAGDGIRVVVAGNHGASALTGPHALLRAGCAVLKLGCVIGAAADQARFAPDDPRTIKELGAAVRGFDADCGIAFDGSGERIAVVDGEGISVPSERIFALFADDLWRRRPGSVVACDLCTGDLPEECLDRREGEIRFIPPGPASMDRAIREGKASLAADSEGRFLFSSGDRGIPDGLVAALRIVRLLARARRESGERPALARLLHGGDRFLSPEKVVDFCAGRAFLDRFAANLRGENRAGEPILSVREDHRSAVRLRCAGGWGVLRLRRADRTLGLRYGGGTDDGFRFAGRMLRDALRKTLRDSGWRETAGERALEEAAAGFEEAPGAGEKEEALTPAT